MWKVIGGVAVGVFVGAAIFEIMQRSYPNLIHRIEDKARNAVDAFREGYTVQSRPSDGG